MTMDTFAEFFWICHSTDLPLCQQCKFKAVERRENKQANQEMDTTNKKCATDCCKKSLSNNNDNFTMHALQGNLCCPCNCNECDILRQKCACNNWNHPDYAGLQVLPPIALRIETFDTVNHQEAALMIVMITEIMIISQLLMITEARIIMPKLEIDQGPILAAGKNLTKIMAIILMMKYWIGDKTSNSPAILAQTGNAHPPLKTNLLWSKCLLHLLHWCQVQIWRINMMP